MIAVVGGESLLGKEVRELLDSSKLPASVKLIASESTTGRCKHSHAWAR